MSGGRFNYVSVRDIDGPGEEHDNIVDALSEYQGADEVVAEAYRVLEKWRDVVDAWARLSPVLKAVEWHQSGDWGDDDVRRAIEAYRSRPR